MKNLIALVVLLATIVSALPKHDHSAFHKRKDDNCEVQWVYVDPPVKSDKSSSKSTGPTPTTTSKSEKSSQNEQSPSPSSSAPATLPSDLTGQTGLFAGTEPKNYSTTGSQGPSALNLPNLPNGQPPIPLNGDYVHAPEYSDPVPTDALHFKPDNVGEFDCLAFNNFQKEARENKNPPASKWMKIEPGNYRYKLPAKSRGENDDANLFEGFNLIIYAQPGGWTLDLRGVTFYVDITPETKLRRPQDSIYTIQSTDLTILGGTLWIDSGELFTQARCTSLTGPEGSQKATFKVMDGYDLKKWREAGPRNQQCVDDSDSSKTTFPECNFWKVENYDFSSLDSSRTFTATVVDSAISKMKEGLIITMIAGEESVPFAMVNEDSSGLVVKGFTTNGQFMSIGVNPGQTPPHYENVYEVNAPHRPGFEDRAHGPGLSWGNLGGMIYNAPGAPKATWDRSWYQNSGNKNNLVEGGENAK